MHNRNTVPFSLNQTLLEQQSAISRSRTILETTGETGSRAAGAAAGSHITFSKILAEETEKQRRQQQLKRIYY